MKLKLYREAGPRSHYMTHFEIKNAQDAFDLVAAISREELRVHFAQLTETAANEFDRLRDIVCLPVAATVEDVIKHLKPKGR